MRDPNNPCLFCNSKASGIAHENNLAYASYDTCLLYTSPSPRDRTRSRMPSSA